MHKITIRICVLLFVFVSAVLGDEDNYDANLVSQSEALAPQWIKPKMMETRVSMQYPEQKVFYLQKYI